MIYTFITYFIVWSIRKAPHSESETVNSEMEYNRWQQWYQHVL